MRRIVLILCSIVLMTLAGGCKKEPAPIVITPDIEKNHLQRNHVFGLVKDMTTLSYFPTDSIPVCDTAQLSKILDTLEPGIKATQTYTSDGFLTRFVKVTFPRDTLLRKYKYNKKAQIVSWKETTALDTVVTEGKYLYDRNGFINGEQVFRGDSVVMAFAYTTDGVGNIIRSAQSFGNYTTRTETKYNENGLVSKIIEYEPNGKMFKTVSIEYDNYGDEVNRRVTKSGNQLIEYTYNQYSQDGRLLKTIYEDKVHKIKENTFYFDFDDQDNWQTEVKAVDNRIVSIRKRKINYYPNN